MKNVFKTFTKVAALTLVVGGTWVASAAYNGGQAQQENVITDATYASNAAFFQALEEMPQPGMLETAKGWVKSALGQTLGGEVTLNEYGLPVLNASVRITTNGCVRLFR
mgnify:CR=1 FL=1